MQAIRVLLAIILCSAQPCAADSSSSGGRDPNTPRTYPGDIPEGCDVIDVTVSLEKWVSYEGPFMDMDVPLDLLCLSSKIYHPLIHTSVHLMCAEGERTLEWRFQGGGRSGEPIEELGNEIPRGKKVTPLKYLGFPMTLSGQEFNAFLDVYNSKIRGGKLGTYSWNPDNYKCSKELNCGGYFLITFQALMGEHILEGYTEDIAKEMKKGIGDCDHFAFELAGNPSQYDEALEGSGQGSEGNDECTEEDFTSDKDKNCYVGPDGKCYEDPGTTYCSGMTQSRNPYLPCYLEPEVRPTTTPTPQACLGASCTIDPTPIPDSTPQPRSCLGSHCEPGRIDDTAVLAATPRVQTCVGSNCTPMPTPTPAAIDPTPIPCSSAAGGSMTNPCVLPTIVPTIATQPTEILCAGTISAGGICSVPVKTESPPATATPLYCNGKTQSTNPKAPCYIAPNSF